MKYGFYSSDYDNEIVEFAGTCGFDCMEINAEYGTRLDIDKINGDEIGRVTETFRENGVCVGTVCCSLNLLDGDLSKRERNIAYMEKMIKTVRKFGTDIITTNVWGNKQLTPEENIPLFKCIYRDIAKLAEAEGVRIGFENCPHYVGYPIPLGNIGYSPEMWEALFDAVPSDNLGLEFDPSHLFWLGIDYIKALRDFSRKVFALHAKDTEIIPELRHKYGIIGRQLGKTSEWDAGWWRYRIPGWGQIDWQGIFKVFYDTGFNGPVIIEHEDPVFDGKLRKQGLRMGLEFLKKFDIPK